MRLRDSAPAVFSKGRMLKTVIPYFSNCLERTSTDGHTTYM